VGVCNVCVCVCVCVRARARVCMYVCVLGRWRGGRVGGKKYMYICRYRFGKEITIYQRTKTVWYRSGTGLDLV
jgi:hypothetical protein